MILIREIKEQDATQLLVLRNQLDEETEFMLLETGERITTPEGQKKLIQRILTLDNRTILVAETDGQIVGYIAGLGGSYRRNRHKADVVIGILNSYSRQGLGTRLFLALEEWARACDLHRLELSVMAHNERAIGLYRKMGFVEEGLSIDSLFVDGRYVDELGMAKILED
jgi:RimJ/RimL family protein N-acetyltransferase